MTSDIEENNQLIQDYALISNGSSIALISKCGSIDWCCVPIIDAPSCFNRLLDWQEGGYCRIYPSKDHCKTTRKYLEGTMILETTFHHDDGEVKIIDFFPLSFKRKNQKQMLLRIIQGVSGSLSLDIDIIPRLEYAAINSWIRRHGKYTFSAVGGSTGLLIRSNILSLNKKRYHLTSRIDVKENERYFLSIAYYPPELIEQKIHLPQLKNKQLDHYLNQTIDWWHHWLVDFNYTGIYQDLVKRSALTIKALSNFSTGAIAAAATTSLPEYLGGCRNWDYRFCWVRDSYFAIRILQEIGFTHEVDHFRNFIERSCFSNVKGVQTLFSVTGRRRLYEHEISELVGFHHSKPVRMGNLAYEQLQLGTYGMIMDLAWINFKRRNQVPHADYWEFLIEIVEFIIENWEKPDSSIWEMRIKIANYVHSKALCWVALDRGIQLSEALGKKVDLDRWKKVRQQIYDEIMEKGYNKVQGVFVQAYEYHRMDASLLLLPMFGFIDYQDERMVRTTRAIMKELGYYDFLFRYAYSTDDIKSPEGVFLPCSFWLVTCLAYQGQLAEAQKIFDTALSAGNELGLFSEEFDPETNTMLGNFPLILTHVSLIGAIQALEQNS